MRLIIPKEYKQHISVDEEGYRAFLRKQGIDDADINHLRVFFFPYTREYDDCIGQYSYLTITLYIGEREMVRDLNHTLLHETRHLLQDVLDLKIEDIEKDAEDWALQYRNQHTFLKWVGDFVVHSPVWLRDYWTTGKVSPSGRIAS